MSFFDGKPPSYRALWRMVDGAVKDALTGALCASCFHTGMRRPAWMYAISCAGWCLAAGLT